MRIDIHHYHHIQGGQNCDGDSVPAKDFICLVDHWVNGVLKLSEVINHFTNKLKNTTMGQKEQVDILAAAKEQFAKAFAEVTNKITTLEEAVNNQDNASEELKAATADLKTLAQKFDDIVADVATPPAEPGTEGGI